MANAPIHLRLSLAVVGFSAVIAQIVLLRELLVVSYGNELSLGIMLALWLIWTAIGSTFLGRFFDSSSSRTVFALLLTICAIAFYLAIILVRSSRSWWGAIPGEVLGPVPIFLTSFFTLAFFCPFSGWLFAAGSRLYADSAPGAVGRAGSFMYLLEALGSATGGILASIILIRFLDSLQIAIIVAIVNFLAANWIAVPTQRTRSILCVAIVAIGISGLLLSPRIELLSLSRSWPGFRIVATRTSAYGNLAVVETEGNRSLIQNGIVLFTVPDQASAEEAVHFPLLEHPAPKSVLLIGGGLNGSLAEILKHPSVARVDYVELDPAVLRLARDCFGQAWSLFAADPRVYTHEQDGRLFLKNVSQQFDVIIVNLPEPQTAQLNRFYTSEFFREVSSKLNTGGIFGFQVRASEEYLSPQMAEFLRCLKATLYEAFPGAVTIPGESVHFLASQEPRTLTTDSGVLLTRLNERPVHTTFIREYYLPFRMAPDRVAALNQQLRPVPGNRINRDFTPIAYYFNVELWGLQFAGLYRNVLHIAAKVPFRWLLTATIGLIIVLAILTFAIRGQQLRTRFVTGYSVAMMGMALMGAEVLLLLGFQAVYGYVFNEIAVIIAGFMAGMAAGSWFALRNQRHASEKSLARGFRRLALVQLFAVFLLFLTTPLITSLGHLSAAAFYGPLLHAAFLFLAVAFGLSGGYQFPVAIRIFSTVHANTHISAGTLYALDLMGASFAAIAISAWLLPLFGFHNTAELLAISNLGPALLLLAGTLRDA